MKRENRKYKIEKAEWREFEGFYNPPLVIEYKGKRAPISAGYGDDIEVFRDSNDFVILTTRENLGYAGIEVFDENLTKIGEVFIQNVDEEIGQKFWDYSSNYQAKILVNYLV